jgi:hypothetical protein
MEHTLGGITFLQFAQIQASTEVFTFAVDDGGTHAFGQFLKQITNGQNQAVVDGVAFLGAAQRANEWFCMFYFISLTVDQKGIYIVFLPLLPGVCLLAFTGLSRCKLFNQFSVSISTISYNI